MGKTIERWMGNKKITGVIVFILGLGGGLGGNLVISHIPAPDEKQQKIDSLTAEMQAVNRKIDVIQANLNNVVKTAKERDEKTSEQLKELKAQQAEIIRLLLSYRR